MRAYRERQDDCEVWEPLLFTDRSRPSVSYLGALVHDEDLVVAVLAASRLLSLRSNASDWGLVQQFKGADVKSND